MRKASTPSTMPAIWPPERWEELEWAAAPVGVEEEEDEEAREDGAELLLSEAEKEVALLEIEVTDSQLVFTVGLKWGDVRKSLAGNGRRPVRK